MKIEEAQNKCAYLQSTTLMMKRIDLKANITSFMVDKIYNEN